MIPTTYLLSDTARLLRKAFDGRVRQLGMTSPQARLLLILSHSEGENQAFYADRLEVEPISLARMLDRMEEAGRVERRPDPADRRAWRVYLTDAGREIIDQVHGCLNGLEDEMLVNLGQTQRATLATLLETIRTNLTNARSTEVTVNG
ncbi:MAG: hypothetical protein RL519_375 [Pseudomonadota bacterium]|jgi:DNA-binding MarR family transcriptional regulator